MADEKKIILTDNEKKEFFGQFSDNLKLVMEKKGYNQKGFAEFMDVAESTLSGYLKQKKAPTIDFLLTLKKRFPQISIDSMLFSEIDTEVQQLSKGSDSSQTSEIKKYFGTYYLYYYDTSKRSLDYENEELGFQSLNLKYGVMYIAENLSGSTLSQVICKAVFGMRKIEDATELKQKIDGLKNFSQVEQLLQEQYAERQYSGQIDLSSPHVFITVNRVKDSQDRAFIILHDEAKKTSNYIGGLGTMNSTSSGRYFDPIVQLIGLSKNLAHVSDEQIKSQLRFARPIIHSKDQPAVNKLLKWIKYIYANKENGEGSKTDYELFNEQNIHTLIVSSIEELLEKNLENNSLCFGRVSGDDDDDWYHLLKESEEYYKKRKQEHIVDGNNF